MDNAVRVLLPISNAQRNLEAAVAEILDVLPEWGGPFELWLLDDGSTDETPDLAHALAAHYPQVRVRRNSVRLGLAGALAAAIAQTGFDFVLLSAALYGLEPDDLQSLWQLRELERKQRGRSDAQAMTCELRMNRWPRIRAGHERGFQLIRRSSVEQMRASQVLTSVRRVDRPAASCPPKGQRPNFLDKASSRVKRRSG